MSDERYADSAQARATDAAYQREQPQLTEHDEQAEAEFYAECNARRERQDAQARERLKRALGELEVFFGDSK